MIRLFLCFTLLQCCSLLGAASDQRSIAELEARKDAVERELKDLARPSLRGGVGAIGFHSASFPGPDHSFSVEIDLEGEYEVDELIIVPVLWRDMDEGFKADAFPEAFRVFVGTADDPQGEVVAEYQNSEGSALGITPVVLPISKTVASWVRIEVPRLSARIHDGLYVFQLSEIFVFSQGQNVALRKPVQTSMPKPRDPSGAWDTSFLVDGSTPYIMNSAVGQQSLGYMGDFGATPVLYIDLGASLTFSGIHLHAVEQSNTVPQAFVGDLGIPRQFKIEGSETEDFKDPSILLNCYLPNISDKGPIMMWNIPESRCRYIRVITIDQGPSIGVSMRLSRVGFAEIELIADGINIAEGKKAWTEPVMRNRRSPLALTDGNNFYGKILPTQIWLQELGRRFDLEMELSTLSQKLSLKYARQKQLLQWMGWGMVLLLFIIVFVVLYGRILRVRNEARVRERIAANLHDELGANLHAIGMWSDIAQDSLDSPKSLVETLQRIRGLTERTGASARVCTNMLEAKGVCEVLVDDMKREASRILSDLEYTIRFENENEINSLKRRKRIDIYLFFKESVTNIIRHGEATSVRISLSVKNRQVELIIADDGCGFSGGLPKSLQRRAKLMRAKADVEHSKEGGTLVWLKLKAR